MQVVSYLLQKLEVMFLCVYLHDQTCTALSVDEPPEG